MLAAINFLVLTFGGKQKKKKIKFVFCRKQKNVVFALFVPKMTAVGFIRFDHAVSGRRMVRASA